MRLRSLYNKKYNQKNVIIVISIEYFHRKSYRTRRKCSQMIYFLFYYLLYEHTFQGSSFMYSSCITPIPDCPRCAFFFSVSLIFIIFGCLFSGFHLSYSRFIHWIVVCKVIFFVGRDSGSIGHFKSNTRLIYVDRFFR